MAEPVSLALRYFAGAAAASGTTDEVVVLPAGSDVAALRAHLVAEHPSLAPVLEVATVLVDGVAARDGSRVLDGARTVDVLPPFSGG